jgi:hypothetical protein
MNSSSQQSIGPLRLTPLATCLAIALATTGALAQDPVAPHRLGFASASFAPPSSVVADRRSAMAHTAPVRAVDATTYEVTSCADDGSPGTLRYVIDNAVGDGDTADLSNLSCSTITLATGEIVIPQNNFTLYSSVEHPVTIDAHGASRVIEHDGSGVLGLVRINLANGYFKYNSGSATAKGGCVLSNGSIGMTTSSVSACQAVNINGQAEGGAIYTLGDLNALASSTISNSTASGILALGGGVLSIGSVYLDQGTLSGNLAFSSGSGANAGAYGGGIFNENHTRVVQSSVSGNRAEADHGNASGGGIQSANGAGVYLAFSAISGNTAVSAASSGGGVTASGSSSLYYSTLDHNQAVNNAALVLSGNSARIGNSTISTNTATSGSSAIFASIPLFVYNSTIAFNAAAGNSAGLYLYVGAVADIESTILSNNTSSTGVGYDLVARVAVNGNHDLIQNPGSPVPGDTLTGVDPQLEPLASNFSLNAPLTHALAPTSPAIDRGTNPRNFNYDERGAFNARVVGISADIGAYEWNGVDTDTIFENGFD